MVKKLEKLKAVYPGTFDPFTNGHLDVLSRALSLFDVIIIGVANGEGKKPLFSADERKKLIEKTLELQSLGFDSSRVLVKTYDNLLVDFAKNNSVRHIMRG